MLFWFKVFSSFTQFQRFQTQGLSRVTRQVLTNRLFTPCPLCLCVYKKGPAGIGLGMLPIQRDIHDVRKKIDSCERRCHPSCD
jgi:hypothetical protein